MPNFLIWLKIFNKPYLPTTNLSQRKEKRSMKKAITFTGEETISIPEAITLDLSEHVLLINGPLGHIEVNLLQHDAQGLVYVSLDTNKEQKNLRLITHSHQAGLALKAFANLLLQYFEGVTKGFLVHLEVVGIGYRVQQKNNQVELRLGYSHSIAYPLPQDVKIFTPKPTQICLFSIDKQRVTQVAAELRQYKLPEVYKGKGIRYKNEIVRKKEGKKK